MKLDQQMEINVSSDLLKKIRSSFTDEASDNSGVFTGILADKVAWITGAVACRKDEDINQLIIEVEPCLPGGVMVCGSYGVVEKLKPPAAFLCTFNLDITEDDVTVTSSNGGESPIVNQLLQDELNKQFNSSFHCCKLRGSMRFNVKLQKDAMVTTTPIKTIASSFAFHLTNHNTILSESNLKQEDQFLPGKTPPPDNSKTSDNKLNYYKQLLNHAVQVVVMKDFSSNQNVGTAPYLKCEKAKHSTFTIPVPLDTLCYVHKDSPTYLAMGTFQSAIRRRLRSCLTTVQTDAKEAIRSTMCIAVPKWYQYLLSNWCHPVSLCYLNTKNDDALLEYRKELLHPRFMEPCVTPVFRRGNALYDNNASSSLLINPHEHLSLPKMDLDSKVSTVKGLYSYHHYMQNNMNDNGWGCAYRSLQTLVSWFIHQGFTEKTVPTHRQIQQILVDIGDKPKSFIGTSKWIGSIEVNNVLNQYLGITSKIMFVSRGSDLANHGRELASHFERHGTPVMIGGGVLAHTILGVSFSETTGDIRYLILDPHYTGTEDIKVISNKGWCGWKTSNFWDQNAYYNLCLPLRPNDVL